MAPVDDLQQELSAIRLLAIQYMLNAIEDADMSAPDRAARSLTQAFADIIQAFGEQAAMSAARYLELDRQVAGVNLPSVVPADTVPVEQIERSLNWALRPLDAGDLRRAEQQMAGSLQRLVEQPARETVWDATVAAKTRYARVPRGADPCPFCLMLASRGGVYSADSVITTTGRSTGSSGRPEGLAFHDNCHCVPMEIRQDDDVPGVTQQLQNLWAEHGGTLAGWTAYLKENPFTPAGPNEV